MFSHLFVSQIATSPFFFFLLPGGASVMSTVKWMDGEILHTYEYISIFHILYIGFMSELERNGKK